MNKAYKEFVGKIVPKIDACLDHYLESIDCRLVLKRAMLYSIDAGGKRIRPVLTLAIVKSLGVDLDDELVKAASAVELIHTYSLIHDDLPEMDNDDLRRGKPTNHKMFGQAMAVLAGDALLTTSFEWLGQLAIDDSKKLVLIIALSKAAGPLGMINGQVGDIKGENVQYNLEELKKVHYGKTAALLEYSCYCGSLLGNATEQQQTELVEFGKKFGLAFQIYDDILDVVATEEKLGKKVHKDNDENKNTYPQLLGLDGAYDALKQNITEMQKILARLQQLGMDCNLLSGFLDYFKISEG